MVSGLMTRDVKMPALSNGRYAPASASSIDSDGKGRLSTFSSLRNRGATCPSNAVTDDAGSCWHYGQVTIMFNVFRHDQALPPRQAVNPLMTHRPSFLRERGLDPVMDMTCVCPEQLQPLPRRCSFMICKTPQVALCGRWLTKRSIPLTWHDLQLLSPQRVAVAICA